MSVLEPWNLEEMEAFQLGLEGLLHHSSAYWPAAQEEAWAVPELSPLVDISEAENEYLIKAELPGVRKADVTVTAEDGMLTIIGERKFEREENGKRYHCVERAAAIFVPDIRGNASVHAEADKSSDRRCDRHSRRPRSLHMAPNSPIMNFTDPRAGICYRSNFTEVEGHSVEQRQVHALMAVHEYFYSVEGPACSGAHEAVWHLLLPRLRSELRRWYQRGDSRTNAAAAVLRSYLSRFLGEDL